MSDRTLVPFRSKHKVSTRADLPPPIPKYMSKHQRKLTLHHIHGPKTWMIDFMTVEGLHILNVIHCNTRFWVPNITKDETAESVLNCIRALVDNVRCDWSKGIIIDTLISDAAKAFTTTRAIRQLCQSLHIQQIVYNMKQGGVQVLPFPKDPTTSQYHNQLSIIDRISRTLRDMIFTVRRTKPWFQLDNRELQKLADIYNHTPHDTLSKTMGFDVSPFNAFHNRRLQDEIVRRWTIANYNIMDKPAFQFADEGSIVYLYAPKELFEKRRSSVEPIPYRIIARNSGNYIIQRIDGTGEPITVQRKDFVVTREL